MISTDGLRYKWGDLTGFVVYRTEPLGPDGDTKIIGIFKIESFSCSYRLSIMQESLVPTPPNNLLLHGLARKERDRILACCEPVDLVLGDVLCEPHRPFPYIYFPLSAFTSMVLIMDTHPPLEMSLIGNEGMLGATLILGIRESSLRAVVQGPGSVLRMKVPKFRFALRECPSLVKAVNRYRNSRRNAACTRFHECRGWHGGY